MVRKISGIIALLTDYGYRDPYVGVLKGVILSINPNAKIIDVTHDITSYDIVEASYVLLTTYREFPEGTIFVVVVDPGVGSSRRAVLVESKRYFFIGPDNGVLRPAIDDDEVIRVVEITNDKYFRKPVSTTFHGRDIFAPVAAYLSLGTDPIEFGKVISISDLVKSRLVRQCVVEGGWVKTNIIHVDRFGNVITGCRVEELNSAIGGFREAGEYQIRVRGVESYRAVYHRSFSLAKPGEIVIYPGSMGYIEIAVYMSSFSKKTDSKRGDDIWIRIL
ncbi:MAG: SAM-dependent chlorinase/fluorinase [Sulfolobales archaeon]